jgi:type I restriction enzyme S subunit
MFPLSDSAMSHALVRHIRDKIPFDGFADSAGRVFMTVIRDFLDGKELGQFFTPPPVVDYLTARAADGRPLGRAFDPTSGSGGFLAAATRAGAAEVHGAEIDIRVRLLGYFNALVSGAVAPRVHRADFTRGLVPDAPFDTVLANPPFGVKGIKYPELVDPTPVGPNGAEGLAAFPLKSSATGLFLQRIVRCLAVGGRGCVVLPLGKELAGKSAAEVLLRRALLTAVDLREIVAIPVGTFENTDIRTAALVFDKRRELGDCLERKRRGKGFAAELRPGLAPATSDVRLVQLRTAADGKTVLAEAEPIPGVQNSVSIEQLEETDWSLSPDDYKLAAPAGAPGAAPLSEYPMVRLGDLCTVNYGTRITKATAPNGPIPVYGGGGETFTTNVHNRENEFVISRFGMSARCVRFVDGMFYLNDSGLTLNTRADICDAAYIGRVLELIYVDVVYSCGKGMAQKNLDVDKFLDIEIPLPPLEVQRAIAAELDAQAADVAALEKGAAAAERAKRVALDNALYRRGFLRAQSGDHRLADGVELVRLGDLFTLKKGSVNVAEIVPGPRMTFTSAAAPTPCTAAPENGVGLVLAGMGTVGRAWAVSGEYGVGRECFLMKAAAPNTVDERYAAWYINLNRKVLVERHAGAAIKARLNSRTAASFEIPLPPLEVQRAITAELDALDATAKGLAAAADRARAAMKKTLELALAGGGGPAVSSGPHEGSGAPGQNDEAQPADAEDLLAELIVDDEPVAARAGGQSGEPSE